MYVPRVPLQTIFSQELLFPVPMASAFVQMQQLRLLVPEHLKPASISFSVISHSEELAIAGVAAAAETIIDPAAAAAP